MSHKQTSLLDNGLIWLTAAISLSEIVAGTLYAGMGVSGAVGSIILGHIIGCFLLFEIAFFGARKRLNAMECVSLAFGQGGGAFFATLNIVQLLGWTAIMIFNGAIVATAIFASVGGVLYDNSLWAVVLGVLIAIWVLLGVKRIWFLNLICAISLIILSGMMVSNLMQSGGDFGVKEGAMGFWVGVEIAVAMPISWLPLIADYTSKAKRPFAASLVSVVCYGIVSTLMYLVGYIAASGGSSDITLIITSASLGIGALLLVLFSTATTTFLDAYSAGESSVSIFSGVKPRVVAFLVVVLETSFVAFSEFDLNKLEPFLLLIGSIFVPMSAVMLADYYRTNSKDSELVWVTHLLNRKPKFALRFVVWAVGVAFFHLMIHFDFIASIPAFVLTFILANIIVKKDNL